MTGTTAVVISGTMANRLSRNVSLTAELDRFIEARLEAGEYGNASEVVRTALKLLREREDVASTDPFWWLKGRGEGYAHALERDRFIRVAIDQQHATHDAPVTAAREVALFPPMTGG